jgi:hypothetical protein
MYCQLLGLKEICHCLIFQTQVCSQFLESVWVIEFDFRFHSIEEAVIVYVLNQIVITHL